MPDSTLEIPKVNDPESPYHGEWPPPQYVDFQLDMIMNFVIDKHCQDVLKSMKHLIFSPEAAQARYPLFLTVFLLPSTIEFAYQWQLRYVELAEGTARQLFLCALLLKACMMLTLKPDLQKGHNSIDFVTRLMLEDWEYSAENLLYHFRTVLHGQIPFSQKSSEANESYAQASVDSKGLEYLGKVSRIVQSRSKCFCHPHHQLLLAEVETILIINIGADFDALRKQEGFKLTTPYVWLSRLFLDN